MSTFVSGAPDSEPVTPVAAVTAGSGGLTIRLAGELDGVTAPSLRDQIQTVIAAGPARDIVVDLTDVDFCDAATVRVFVLLASTVTTNGAALHLHNARPHIAWLLNHLGAGHLLVAA
jgi:anti-anti-sigma factor